MKSYRTNRSTPARRHIGMTAVVSAAMAVLGSSIKPASADVYTWAAPNNDNWSTGFTPSAPPSDFGTQLVFTAGSYTANNDIGAFNLGSMAFNNSASDSTDLITVSGFNSLTFGGTSPALAVNGGSATIVGQIVTTNGTQIVNNGAGTLNLSSGVVFATNGTTTINNTGIGTIVLPDAPVPYFGTNSTINLSNTGGGLFQIGNLGSVSGVTTGIAGTLNITAGPVTFAGNTGGDLFGNSLILNVAAGASFNFANNGETFGGLTGSGNVIQGTAGLTFTEFGNREFDGVISGTGTVAQNVDSILTLGGQNTYTGITTIEAGGTIVLATTNAIPAASQVNVSSGTLILGGYSQTFHGLAGGNQSGFLDLGASTLTLNGSAGGLLQFLSPLTGSGNVVINASTGLQSLLGSNTYTGTTTVNSGTLRILGNNLLTNSGTTVASGATLDVILPTDGSWTAPLTDNGGLAKEGAGNLTFASAEPNVSLTSLTVLAGTLTLNHTATNSSEIGTGMPLTLGTATMALTGNSSAASSQTFSGTTLQGAGQFTVTAGTNQNASIVAGSCTRSPQAGSTVNFTLNNSGSGVASVTTTTLNSSLGTIGGYATFNSSGWAVSGSTAGTAYVVSALPASNYSNSFATGIHTDMTASLTAASGTSTGDVRFNSPTAATLTLTGTNIITDGGILVTPNVGANTSTITANKLTAPANQDLIFQQFDTAGPLAVASVISNTAGTGTTVTGVTVTATNYKQTLTLPATSGVVVGEHVVINTSGGTVTSIIPAAYNGIVDVVTPINSSNSSVSISYITNTSSGSTTPTPVASTGDTAIFTLGTNVVKSGPGQMLLTGANTFTGELVLNQGVTTISAASNQGATSASGSSSDYFDGGTLEITGALSGSTGIQPWIVGPAGATIQVDNATTTVSKVGNTFWGTGDVHLTGPGIFSIGSTGSSFTGRIFVDNGTLQLTSNQIASSTGVIVANGAQFKLLDTTSGPFNFGPGASLVLNGNGPNNTGAWNHTLDEAGSADYAFNSQIILASTSRFVELRRVDTGVSSGYDTNTDIFPLAISGPGNLIKDGDGTMVLSSPFNTYGSAVNPTTTISNGTLQIAATNGIPSNNTLQFGETGSSNSGTFDLSGQNQTVAGLTVAGSGPAHQIVNSSTATSSTLTVNYNGASNQVFTPQIGGGSLGSPSNNNINFVKSGTGTFSLTGTTTFSGSVTVNAGTLRIADSTLSHDYTVADGAGLILTNNTGNTLPANSLTLGTSGTTNLTFELQGTSNPTAGLVAVSTSNGVTLNGTVDINLSSLQSLTTGIFPLITYSGSLQGSAFAALKLGTLPSSRVSATLMNDAGSIDLDITAVDFLKWTGVNSNVWDIATTPNFALNSSGAATTYLDQPSADAVTFDDSAKGSTNVTLNTILHPGAVTVNNNSLNYTFGGTGSIAGNTGITKAGTGSLTILTNNTNAGTTSILGGTVNVGNGGTTGSLGSGGITDNGSLVINRSDDQALSQNIGGTGNLTKSGSNTLTLNGALNLTGSTTISGGTLVANSGVIGSVGGAGAFIKAGIGTLASVGDVTNTNGVTISAGVLQIGNGTAAGTLQSDVTVASGAYLGFARSDTYTYAGNVSGGGGVSSVAGDTLLTGNLTYTGPTKIAAGSTLEFAGNGNTTLSNVVSGSGTFNKSGSGQLILLNSNTFNGTMNVNGGTVLLADEGASGDLDVTNLQINSTGRFIFGLGIAGGGIVGENPDFPNSTFITVNTGGTFEIRIGETYGATSIQGGTFEFNCVNGAVGATQAATGGEYPFTPFTGFDARSGTIVAANANGVVGTISAEVGDGFNKSTGGEVDVVGPVAFTSATPININQGILSFQPVNVPTTGTAAVTLNGGTLRMTGAGAGTIARQVTVSNNSSIDLDNAGGTLTLSTAINGSGNLTKTGPGTLVVTPGSLSGTTTVAAGTLTLNPGTASGAFAVADAATLGVASTAVTIPSLSFGNTGSSLAFNIGSSAPTAPLLVISNTDGLQTNGGTEAISITGSQTYTVGEEFPLIGYTSSTGPLSSGFAVNSLGSRINAGIVYNASGNSIDVSIISIGGSTVWTGAISSTWDMGTAANVGGTNNFRLASDSSATNFINGDSVLFDDTLTPGSNNVSLAAALSPSSVTVNNTAEDYTFRGTGSLTGATTLTKLGTGTLTLTTDNTYTGATTITAGTLALGNGGTTGSITSSTISVAAGATLAVNRSADLTYNGAISGAGTVNKAGSGTLYLGGSNPFTGTVNVNGGTILLEDLGLGGDLNASLININNGGRFIFGLGPAYGGSASENPDFPDTTFVTINTGGTFELRVGEEWGATSLQGGTLLINGAVGADSAATLAAEPTAPYLGFDLQSGTISAINTGTGSGTLTAASAGGGVNKSTTGEVDVTGPVLISATTPINIMAGVLSFQLQNVPGVGTAAISLGSTSSTGTLRLADGGSVVSIARPVVLNTGGGVIDIPTATGGLNVTSAVTGAGSLTQTGLGSLTLSGSDTFAGGITLGTGTDAPRLMLSGKGAFPAGGNLTVNSGASVKIAAHTGTPANTVVVQTGMFTSQGLIDITNNDLTVHTGGSLSAVAAQIASGYANGTWTGTSGITSSTAASDSTHLTAVGVLINNESAMGGASGLIWGSGTTLGAFDGTNPALNDLLVKYTYYGDTNLDGGVDGSDYTNIDNGFNNHLSGWQNGDFNYDGKVDGSDYTLIDNAFNTQGTTLGSNPAALVASSTAQLAGGSNAVPEPAAISVLSIGGLGLLARRRRSK